MVKSVHKRQSRRSKRLLEESKYPFREFDFSQLDSIDFREDSVREVLIAPLLDALGYSNKGPNRVRRSPRLKHPFVKTGSRRAAITSVPDYLMEISGKPSWVLDAKDPQESVVDPEHRQQVYFYAIHPEINVQKYALCNGREIVVFRVNEDHPCFLSSIADLAYKWHDIFAVLSPDAFGGFSDKAPEEMNRSESFYVNRSLLPEIPVRKQQARRHFGVHGYFTKQSWNVVQKYVEHFSQPGDIVLDPFGGSGVTGSPCNSRGFESSLCFSHRSFTHTYSATQAEFCSR